MDNLHGENEDCIDYCITSYGWHDATTLYNDGFRCVSVKLSWKKIKKSLKIVASSVDSSIIRRNPSTGKSDWIDFCYAHTYRLLSQQPDGHKQESPLLGSPTIWRTIKISTQQSTVDADRSSRVVIIISILMITWQIQYPFASCEIASHR